MLVSSRHFSREEEHIGDVKNTKNYGFEGSRFLFSKTQKYLREMKEVDINTCVGSFLTPFRETTQACEGAMKSFKSPSFKAAENLSLMLFWYWSKKEKNEDRERSRRRTRKEIHTYHI